MAKKATKKNVFVGREKEIDTIKGIIKSEPKANILISGVTGMGKTELCIQIKELLAKDKKIHCGSYRVESKLEDPVNPFLEAFFEVLHSIAKKAPARSKLKWVREVFTKDVWKKAKGIGVAVFKDGVGSVLKNLKEKAETGRTASALRGILEDASTEWYTKSTVEDLLVENKETVITTYLGLLRRISERSPDGHKFVLIFDQVENTSEVFQEFLKSIARNLPHKFYLLFALNHEVKDGVNFLSAHKADLMFFKTKPVELEGFNNLEIRKLIEEIRGVYMTPDVVDNVRRLTDGRPLMIITWINSKDFDLSVIDEDKLSLEGYYEENLKAAGGKAKKLARVLSLLPFPLKAGLADYAAIMAIDNSDCDKLLEKLESQNIFRKYPEGCWFSHRLIKEYILSNTDDAIRNEGAEQIINYLKHKYRTEIRTQKLTAVAGAYAEVLSFTKSHQESFDQNLDLGKYQYNISAYQAARAYFGNALESARLLKDKAKIGSVLNQIGLIYEAWGKYDRALKYFNRSLALCAGAGDRKTQGMALNNMGSVYYDKDEHNEAIRYYRKALKILRAIGDRKKEGVVLNNIGTAYSGLAKYRQAMYYGKKTLEITREVGDRMGEEGVLNNIGTIYATWGQYDLAVDFYQKALNISEKIGDLQCEGVVRNNIGRVHALRGEYDKAMKHYNRSLKISEEIADRRTEAVSISNIGSIWKAQNKYDEAIKCSKKALRIAEDIKCAELLVRALNDIGLMHFAHGEYGQAMAYYSKGLAASKGVGYRIGEGRSLNRIGEVRQALGDYDQALEYYNKSLKVIKPIGARREEGVILSNLASTYEDLHHYGRAIKCCERSLTILEEIGVVQVKKVRENLKLLQEKMKKR